MGGKSGGGNFQVPGTPLAQPWSPSMGTAPVPAGGGGGGNQLQGSQKSGVGQYNTLNQAVAASIAQEAAKGFGKVAAAGVFAPNIFTPTMAVMNAGRAGLKEYQTIQDQQRPSGAKVIGADKTKKGGIFGSPLNDDDDDNDTFGGSGGSANFGGDPIGF